MSVQRVISAVVFDWAGTVIDYGCCAPAHVFIEVFKRCGIIVNEAQARLPMGAAKRDHIAQVMAMTAVQTQWLEKFGKASTDDDVERVYQEFLPLQREVLSQYTTLIPGAAETFAWLKKNDVAVASTTGYTRDLMECILPAAAQQGFAPDAVVCSDDVRAGRPAPWMIYEALQRVACYPVWSCVKVDDTPVGIMAGKNAGAWTVAVTKTGNQLGLPQAVVESMPEEELEERLEAIRVDFLELGADYVIDGVDQLPAVLERVAQRISEGRLPPQ